MSDDKPIGELFFRAPKTLKFKSITDEEASVQEAVMARFLEEFNTGIRESKGFIRPRSSMKITIAELQKPKGI